MVHYLIKYYFAITFGCVFPIMLILNILPQQTLHSLIFPSIRWAGIIGIYLTYYLFEKKNYWVLYYNLRLQGIYILFGIAVVYEISTFLFGVWILLS